jgi:hypothetical protein
MLKILFELHLFPASSYCFSRSSDFSFSFVLFLLELRVEEFPALVLLLLLFVLAFQSFSLPFSF